ncbi:MAG: HD domain-containing protein, partial [Treponemataceae bacterium]|nr:HD domain-containing protein [Treponemataceae bacterium]
YTVEKTLAAQTVAEKISGLCAYLKEHQQYVLRIMPTDEARGKHFLVNHSMRSTVLALIIGMTLRLPADKLTELGTACLLHEIGQIRLPPPLYMTKGPLSPEERDKMAVHPILSYNILKENDFSLPVQIAALEHHEREDGSGYPRKLTGEHITAFAKIIAAACSFEAITAPRHFREARTAYEAMLDMLKEHEPQYDKIVLKALVHSLSLFPIGAFVCLANGKTAQVIKNTPGNPTHPAVKLTDGTGEHETDDGDYKIVRVLNAQEAESLKNDAE